MKERNFTASFRESFLALYPHGFYCKIPDSINTFSKVARFTAQKPFDCFLIKDGKPFAFELKLKNGAHGLSISALHHKTKQETGGDIKLHQIDNLLKVEESGGTGAFLICYNFINKEGTHINEFYVIPVVKYKIHRDDAIRGGDKSLSYKAVKERYVAIQRIKTTDGTNWDLNKMFGCLSPEESK